MNSKRSVWLVPTTALALLLAACGGGGRDDGGDAASSGTGSSGDTAASVEPSPGITDTEVRLGTSTVLSGPASAYASISRSTEAYFRYVNDELGGVKMGDGKTRKISFTVLDDGYEPARAVENARRLVEQEKVFATFQTLGTPPNSATWDYYNQQEMPNLFVATGAGMWGADPEEHPWTIGWQLAYPTESAIYAEFLKREKPDAKVAVLYANDDFGKDVLGGFKRAIEGSDVTIVAEQPYATTDPTVDAQVQNLSTTGADVFFNVTTPKFAAQAIKKMGEIGWKPQFNLLHSVSNSKASVLTPAGLNYSTGIYSVSYLKDPSDPQWANDAGMNDYRARIAKHGAGLDPNNPFHVYGFSIGETMVKTLENTDAPTREALMESVRNLDHENSLLLPGARVKTGEGDGFPVEGGQLQRFNGDRWELQGDVIDYEGKTPIGDE